MEGKNLNQLNQSKDNPRQPIPDNRQIGCIFPFLLLLSISIPPYLYAYLFACVSV